jgi:hypothetical protein
MEAKCFPKRRTELELHCTTSQKASITLNQCVHKHLLNQARTDFLKHKTVYKMF